MPLTLTRAHALGLAQSCAARYDLPWPGVTQTTYWGWWLVTAEACEFEVETGGEGNARRQAPFGGVARCVFRHRDPAQFWLPLWAAHPVNTPLTHIPT